MSAYVRRITVSGNGNGGRAQGVWLRDGVSSGKFELTFVAVDPATGKQWEEDPEFDTGN